MTLSRIVPAVTLAILVGCAPLGRQSDAPEPASTGDTALVAPSGFERPVRLEVGGQPIDVDIGHAAPCVVDWDRDGDRDLLVGQFGEGKLRIYTNVGTDRAPRYEGPSWFEAGGVLATVPAG